MTWNREIEVQPKRRRLVSLLAATLSFLGLSCAEQDPAGAKQGYWPDSQSAESALRASLGSWTPGRPQQSLENRRPRVETWVSTRADGRALLGYHVVGQVGTNDERIYAVRLELDNPPETRVARYLVRGLNPIWVFRWEDYERISHWEHDMTDPSAEESLAEVPHHEQTRLPENTRSERGGRSQQSSDVQVDTEHGSARSRGPQRN